MDFEKLLEKVGTETAQEAIAAGREIKEILVSSIGYYSENRELTDDDCQDLFEELQADGFDLIHPVVVFPDEREDRDYTLIVGERRLRAFRMGNQEKIIAIVRRDLTPQQIREKNIKENTQRKDEGLASLSRRYKKYCEDFKVSQKSAAATFNVRESVFSDMVKYLWEVDQIPETKALLEEGVSDKWMLKELVRASRKNAVAVKSIIAFAKANNCFGRDFILAAVKVDLQGDVEAELRKILAGDAASESNPSAKARGKRAEEQLALDVGTSENGDTSDINGQDNTDKDVPADSEDDNTGEDASANSEDDNTGEDAPANSEDDNTGKDVPADGSGVKKRPVSKAEIMVDFQGQQFYLELGLVAEEEDKIVLRNLSGDIVLVNPGEVKICYVS